MADAIAGKAQVTVGGVLPPGLSQGVEEGLNFGPAGMEQRAQDSALGELDDGVNAGKALGPRATQEFRQHGLGLIVQGVRGGDGVERGFNHEGAKPLVAQAPRRFFDGLGGFASGIGAGGSSRVHMGLVEWQPEGFGQFAAKIAIPIGFLAAEAVVQMGNMQDEAQFPAPLGEEAEKRDGIGTAGEAYGEAEARGKQGCVDSEVWRCATHHWMIRKSAGMLVFLILTPILIEVV